MRLKHAIVRRPCGADHPCPTGGASAALRGGLAGVVLVWATMGAGMGQATEPFDIPVLPSGLEPYLQEALLDEKPDGKHDYLRLRFVAPEIGGEDGPEFADLIRDLEVLCNEYGRPLAEAEPRPIDRIVVSISDRETEFGFADPEATQFFEAYRVENGVCIWEEF